MIAIAEIVQRMGFPPCFTATQFLSGEDGAPYDVWKLEFSDRTCVLKKAKGREGVLYADLLSANNTFSPGLLGSSVLDGQTWLLLEYIPGNDLTHCTRSDLTLALDALIRVQRQFWEGEDPADTFAEALANRENRLKYLSDTRLESAYMAYLQDFRDLPRTLCHDDLLPFNVLVNDSRAVLIDWEFCGILPWPTSLARLIAHGDEDETAFFYMKEADKSYAIDYFYRNFIKKKGISYDSYRKSVDLALFYEYCEWVYVGNRYKDQGNDRYRKYLHKALKAAEELGY